MWQIELEFGRRFLILHWMFTIACHYLIYIFLPHVSELRRINYFVEWYLQLFHVFKKSFEVFEWLLRRKMRYYARKSEENWTFWIFEKACQNRVFPDNLDFFAATIYPLKRRWGGSSKFFSRKRKVWSSQGLKDNFLWQNINMTVTKIEKKILASGRLVSKGLRPRRVT